MPAGTTEGAGFLPARLVEARYGISNATLDRWLADPDVALPRPMKVRGQRYWSIAALEAWEAERQMLAPAAVGGLITLSDPVTDYLALVAALKRRRNQLGMSCAELEHVSGLQPGYTTKLEHPEKKFGRVAGPVALPLWLQGLKVGLVLVDNLSAISRQMTK